MARANVVPLKKAKTIGQLIDELAECEATRTAHAVAGKKLDLEKTALQAEIFKTLDEQGTLSGSSKTRRISVSESEEPQTEDWEEFLAWAAKNKCLHLVQRRVGAPAWREIKALPTYRKSLKKVVTKGDDGISVTSYEVPGLKTFVKRNLSFTTIAPK